MRNGKAFDCVNMKQHIQEELARDHVAPDHLAQFEKIVGELERADDVVARKWRTLSERRRTGTTPECDKSRSGGNP